MAGGAVRATNYLRAFQKSGGSPSFCEKASSASKFLLPDDIVFQELAGPDFRGLPSDLELRLPFPQVLLEIPISRGGGGLLIYAWETDLVIRASAASSKRQEWSPVEFCGALPRKDFVHPDGGLRMAVESPSQKSSQWVLEAVVAFCSLLACSNVRAEPLPVDPKLAKAAAKRGALPFDTYHVLTVGTASSGAQRLGHGGGRSPREHLRRGHIRRLEDGRRLWVNATVVNPGVGGTVTKAYAVK